MKFINYTNDGRVVVQHAALILSKLDETDTLELHTMTAQSFFSRRI